MNSPYTRKATDEKVALYYTRNEKKYCGYHLDECKYIDIDKNGKKQTEKRNLKR